MLTDFSELLRNRALASFSNECHDPEDGKFCKTGISEHAHPLLPQDWSKALSAQTEKALKSTPEGSKLYYALITIQSLGGNAARKSVEKYVKGEKASSNQLETGQAIVENLRNIPASIAPESLHRGLTLRGSPTAILKKYAKGSNIDLNISSFSEDRRVADLFAATDNPNVTRVILTLEGEKKAIPTQNLAPSLRYAREKEWVTGGRFKVTHDPQITTIPVRTWSAETNKWSDTGKKEPAVLIKIRQVSTL